MGEGRGGVDNAGAENARVENMASKCTCAKLTRCDINYMVSPEKHVDIMEFKPQFR